MYGIRETLVGNENTIVNEAIASVIGIDSCERLFLSDGVSPRQRIHGTGPSDKKRIHSARSAPLR